VTYVHVKADVNTCRVRVYTFKCWTKFDIRTLSFMYALGFTSNGIITRRYSYICKYS